MRVIYPSRGAEFYTIHHREGESSVSLCVLWGEAGFDAFAEHTIELLGLPVVAAPAWGRPHPLLRSAGAEQQAQGHKRLSQRGIARNGIALIGGMRMYAVIRAGGKQYRVSPGDVIRVEKLTSAPQHEVGREVEFGDVLVVSGGDGQIGRPQSEARVMGTVVGEGRGDKILVFHYKRKKQYKRLRGHRQPFTAVRITEIAFDGQKFTAPALPEKQPKPKKQAAADEREAAEPKAKAARAAKKKAKTGAKKTASAKKKK